MENTKLIKLHNKIYGGEKAVCLALRRLIRELTIKDMEPKGHSGQADKLCAYFSLVELFFLIT